MERQCYVTWMVETQNGCGRDVEHSQQQQDSEEHQSLDFLNRQLLYYEQEHDRIKFLFKKDM